jgi:hypothetical protein
MSLTQVLEQLKNFQPVTADVPPFALTVATAPPLAPSSFTSNDAVEAVFVGQNLEVGTSDAQLKEFVQQLSAAKGRSLYNGFRVYYLPSSKEILQYLVRGAASAHLEKRFDVTVSATDAAVAAAKGAAHIPQGELDKYLMTKTFLDVTNSPGPKNWDARVKMVQDRMVSGARASGESAFDPANLKKAPGLLTQLPFGNDPVVRAAAPSGPYGVRVAASVPLSYVVKEFRGGSASAHAPLYPSVVMNGGASPFAMYGGDAKSVANITAKLKSMENQVMRQAPGLDLTTKPSELAAKLGTDITALVAAQTQLQNALLAVSTGPYAPGVKPDTYDNLAKAGAEINEKAAKVSRGWDRLSKIEIALEELLMKTKSVALSGGLHNALKH